MCILKLNKKQIRKENIIQQQTMINKILPPCIGLGTYLIENSECLKVCIEAIRIGYRHIDTASGYHNEEAVGTAIKQTTSLPLPSSENTSSASMLPCLKREDLFITTKLSPTQLKTKSSDVNSNSKCNTGKRQSESKQPPSEEDLIYSAVVNALQDSLSRLQLAYVDCYMMHWPGIGGLKVDDPTNAIKRREAWRAMCDLKAQGLCKLIAVSNFEVRHFESLKPLVNVGETNLSTQRESERYTNFQMPDLHQLELHPLCRQQEVVDYCYMHNISVQQYSPLGSAAGKDSVLGHPSVMKACQSIRQAATNALGGDGSSGEHFKAFSVITPAQVVLIWGLVYGGMKAQVSSSDSVEKVHDVSKDINSCGKGMKRQRHDGKVIAVEGYDSLVVRSKDYQRLEENFAIVKMLQFINKNSDEDKDNGGIVSEVRNIHVFREDVLSTLNQLNNETYTHSSEGDIHMCWSSNKILY